MLSICTKHSWCIINSIFEVHYVFSPIHFWIISCRNIFKNHSVGVLILSDFCEPVQINAKKSPKDGEGWNLAYIGSYRLSTPNLMKQEGERNICE